MPSVDVLLCPLASGWAGSLEQPGRRPGDRREEGRGGGEEQSLHSHSSLPMSSPEDQGPTPSLPCLPRRHNILMAEPGHSFPNRGREDTGGDKQLSLQACACITSTYTQLARIFKTAGQAEKWRLLRFTICPFITAAFILQRKGKDEL